MIRHQEFRGVRDINNQSFMDWCPIKFIGEMSREDFLNSDVKTVHKFQALEYSLNTLDTRSFWMANPVTWQDPFEKGFFNCAYNLLNDPNNLQQCPWQGRVFCICFCLKDVTEAHWSTYNKSEIPIDLQINRDKLFVAFSHYTNDFDIYFGKVNYEPTSEIRACFDRLRTDAAYARENVKKENFARLLLKKRMYYSHEDEIRVIMISKEDNDQVNNFNGFPLEYHNDPAELVNSVIVGPSVSDHTYELLRSSLIFKYGFNPKPDEDGRYIPRVTKSDLYQNLDFAKYFVRVNRGGIPSPERND